MAGDVQVFVVREMALLNSTQKDTTKMIDVGNAKEIVAVIEVQGSGGTSPSLSCNCYGSLDGETWFAFTDLNFTAATVRPWRRSRARAASCASCAGSTS